MRRPELSKSTFHGLTSSPCVISLGVAFLLGAGGCGGSSSDSAGSGSEGGPAPETVIDGGFIDAGITSEESACTWKQTMWLHSGDGTCSYCTGLAQEAPCTCTSDPAVATCHPEALAVTANADCTSAVKDCLTACLPSAGCSCEDTCLQGHDSCRTTEGALNACLINICTSRCD